MYYEFQRWYDSSIGRFISEDPLPGSLSGPQSLNPYVYVENRPTVFSDPSGLAGDWPSFGYCYDYCGYYGSGEGAGIIVLLGGDVSHLRGLTGFLRVGGPGYGEPVSLDNTGPTRTNNPVSGEIPLTTKNIQVSSSGLSNLIGNGREGYDAESTGLPGLKQYGPGPSQPNWESPYATPTDYTRSARARAELAMHGGNPALYVRDVTTEVGTPYDVSTVKRYWGQPGGGIQFKVASSKLWIVGPWRLVEEPLIATIEFV